MSRHQHIAILGSFLDLNVSHDFPFLPRLLHLGITCSYHKFISPKKSQENQNSKCKPPQIHPNTTTSHKRIVNVSFILQNLSHIAHTSRIRHHEYVICVTRQRYDQKTCHNDITVSVTYRRRRVIDIFIL